MTTPVILAIVFGVLTVVALVLAALYEDYVGWNIGWIVVAIVTGLFSFGFGVFATQLHFDRVTCRNFATQTNRQTKFVFYNRFSWDCLVKTSNGKYIPKDNLREFGEQTK